MNEFKLLGRLNWLKIQYFDNGTCMTSIYLGKKKPKTDEYETFPILFFNTKKDNVAERLAECCVQGDYIRINGKISINEYESKDGKKHTKIELIGWNFKKVKWNSELNKYEDIDVCEGEELPETEQAA